MTSLRLITALSSLVFLSLISTSSAGDSGLLTNGDFFSGLQPWTLDRINEAQGSVRVEDIDGGKVAAHVAVPCAAEKSFYIQLFQGGLKIAGGAVYHLSFRARSQPGVTIGLNLMLGAAPWTNLWKQDVTLTPEWKTFSVDVSSSQTVDNARVTFTRLAAQAGDYWFADVSLTEAK